MPKCRERGASAASTARFCGMCGKPLASAGPVAAAAAPAPTSTAGPLAPRAPAASRPAPATRTALAAPARAAPAVPRPGTFGDEFLAPPADPAGILFEASERPILCMSVLGNEAALGGSDHGVNYRRLIRDLQRQLAALRPPAGPDAPPAADAAGHVVTVVYARGDKFRPEKAAVDAARESGAMHVVLVILRIASDPAKVPRPSDPSIDSGVGERREIVRLVQFRSKAGLALVAHAENRRGARALRELLAAALGLELGTGPGPEPP
eukprot:tig00000042_g15617.t1